MSKEISKIKSLDVTTPKGGFYFLVSFNRLKEALIKNKILTSNELSGALLTHPFHFAALTGDACLFKPDDYTARIAFVDYNGKEAFENYISRPPTNVIEEFEFFKDNAPNMFQAIEVLKNFVSSLKS